MSFGHSATSSSSAPHLGAGHGRQAWVVGNKACSGLLAILNLWFFDRIMQKGLPAMIKKLLLGVLVLTIGVPSIADAQKREVVSTAVRADRDYWSSNRMRRARDMPLPRVSSARLSALLGEDQGGTEESTISLPTGALQFSSSRLTPRSARTVASMAQPSTGPIWGRDPAADP